MTTFPSLIRTPSLWTRPLLPAAALGSPPNPPSALTTLQQGTTGNSGLLCKVLATALDAPGFPISFATRPYVQTFPYGIVYVTRKTAVANMGLSFKNSFATI